MEARDPFAGATLAGRYRLIAQLGRGGMSSVYLARHMLIDRLSAIKILRRDLASDPHHRDRFLREARAVNRVQHENIVEITDYGETEGGVVFLVMEYVAGQSLLAQIARGRLLPLRAVDIAIQIASALGRAHQMKVVHRDLKPDNILLVEREDGADHVKLLDFGIAKILDAPALTLNDKIFGTPGYIAPEYAAGSALTPQTDLYSLGVVLYEMTTGALPFEAEFAGDLLLKHMLEPPVPPRDRVPSLLAALEAVILRCLEKKPELRHRDAFHLLEDLAAVRRALLAAPLDQPDEDDGDARADEAATTLHVAGTSRSSLPSVPPVRADEAFTALHVPGVLLRHSTPPPALLPAPAAFPARPAPPSPLDDDVIEPRTVLRLDPTPALTEPTITTRREVALPSVLAGQVLEGPRAWSECLALLRSQLADGPMSAPRAVVEGLVERMATLVHAMEDEALRAEALKLRMLSLEARGRDFRTAIGRAIEALGRDLSGRQRERDGVAARRLALEERREAALREGRGDPLAEGVADALLWEIAAVEEVLREAVAECEDLEFQVRELGTQLERLSEALEADQGVFQADLLRTFATLREQDAALRELARELDALLGSTAPDH